MALRHLAHMTQPEIAEVMGVRRGTVSSTLRAAYANLEDSLVAEPARTAPEDFERFERHGTP